MAKALLAGAGCVSAGGTSDTQNLLPADAGPDAVVVFLDGGGAPAVPPDGAALCPTGACNYQTGAGCSGTTTACIPEVSGATAVPACSPPGTVDAGAACTQVTDCTAGHLCAGGTCRKLCCGGDWTGCDSPAEHCLEALSYAGAGSAISTGAMLCYPVGTCDALAPSTCPSPTTCQSPTPPAPPPASSTAPARPAAPAPARAASPA